MGNQGGNLEEKPFTQQLKSTQWITNVMKSLTQYSKLQEAFSEFAKFIKKQKTELNDSKLSPYDEIETLRIKYEYGRAAARRYEQRCKNIKEEFQRIFIERDINFKRDLDNS